MGMSKDTQHFMQCYDTPIIFDVLEHRLRGGSGRDDAHCETGERYWGILTDKSQSLCSIWHAK